MNIIKKLWQRHFGAQQPQSHTNKCKKVGEICCPALDFREFLEFVCIHKCLAQKNCVCGSSADVELVSFCEPDTGKNLGNAFRIKDEKEHYYLIRLCEKDVLYCYDDSFKFQVTQDFLAPVALVRPDAPEGKYYAFRGTYLRKKGYLVVNEILICNPADNSEQTLLKPQEPLSIGNALKHLQKIFNKDDN